MDFTPKSKRFKEVLTKHGLDGAIVALGAFFLLLFNDMLH